MNISCLVSIIYIRSRTKVYCLYCLYLKGHMNRPYTISESERGSNHLGTPKSQRVSRLDMKASELSARIILEGRLYRGKEKGK